MTQKGAAEPSAGYDPIIRLPNPQTPLPRHRCAAGPVHRLKACATGRPAPVACLVIIALSNSPAFAQDELEEVLVTGTRIARRDFESASPIVSVTQEFFERTGSSTVETALNTLPQFVPAYTSTSILASNGGQANVQLRGLGPASTLILMDSKRLIPANGTGVVDLNIIPPSLIESVEIITGGASAVYGSDAIAGVVNFQLKNDFDGVEFEGHWGQTERGDGADYGGGVTAGGDFADGRGSVLGYVGYAERETVLSTKRDFPGISWDTNQAPEASDPAVLSCREVGFGSRKGGSSTYVRARPRSRACLPPMAIRGTSIRIRLRLASMPMARSSPRGRASRDRCSISVASATRSPSTIAFTPPTAGPTQCNCRSSAGRHSRAPALSSTTPPSCMRKAYMPTTTWI